MVRFRTDEHVQFASVCCLLMFRSDGGCPLRPVPAAAGAYISVSLTGTSFGETQMANPPLPQPPSIDPSRPEPEITPPDPPPPRPVEVPPGPAEDAPGPAEVPPPAPSPSDPPPFTATA
jgi:hypothetical protein